MAKKTSTSSKNVSKKKTAVKKTVASKTQKAGSKSKVVKKKVAKKEGGAKKKVTKTAKAVKKGGKSQKKKTAAKKTTKVVVKKEGGSRYFKVKYNNQSPTGRFSGTKPKQAANKALTSILKLREGAGESTKVKIKFSIVECTRGSKHKEYSYVGERVELDKPMEVKIGKGPNAKTIKYRYNNKVFKDKVAKK